MSDEQKKPPESADNQPQTPPIPAEPIVSEPASDASIATSEPIVSIPAGDSVTVTPEPIDSTPAEDTPTLRPEPAIQKPDVVQEPQPTKPRLLDRVLPSFRKFERFWDATLKKIRSLLPAAWNEKLSDWALTGAIAGIVVLVLWTTVALLPQTPEQLAKAPPNTIEAPPALKAPKPPQPVEVEPLPEPELTPEQSLIAAIQTQVAQITDQYGNGLIQSIEVNFLKSRLVVKVSDGWYELKEPQQNKLADEILRRSGDLDFTKLEIADPQGAIVARSPVVGSNMVILKRQRQQLATNL